MRDEDDVRLAGVPGGIVLVVILRDVKSLEGFECGDNRRGEYTGFIELANIGFRDAVLLFIGIKDGGAVLAADIISLPVELGWIMGDGEMNF